eukprot:TRINITY_DN6568_c0_g2_i10.p1 TRINITY_DN6568_c0_g2~~TRINITY_DN6568_c0_g2_i10.p1  ORF type:complete len:461 (+),score=158.94 TRINITY_DN6568_c0_g2_i10:73-1455(+)
MTFTVGNARKSMSEFSRLSSTMGPPPPGSDGPMKWLVLSVFAYTTTCNSFMYMDFASAPDLAKEIFNTVEVLDNGTEIHHELDSTQLNLLYSASLITVLPLSLPASHFVTSHNYLTMLFGVCCNVIGAWLRYLSVSQGSYPVALLSSIFIGACSSVCITSVAYIPDKWFPGHLCTLATSIGVQVAYTGWGLATVAVPYLATDDESMEQFLLTQAFVVSGTLGVFFLFYKSPPTHETVSMKDASFLSTFWGVMARLFSTKAYVIQLFCFSVLGGLSFSITAVQAELFTAFSTKEGAWTNFTFVTTGVLAGMAFGSLPRRHTDALLVFCFILCAVALASLTTLVHYADDIEHDTLYMACLCMMGLAGIASLGFIGPALTRACRSVPDVDPSFSGGGIEWWIQVWGSVLTLISTGSVGFAGCAVAAWLAAIVFVLCLGKTKRRKRRGYEDDLACEAEGLPVLR